RLVGVVLNVSSVVLMYLIVKEVFKREDTALIASFLTAINPLLVFFSHNVQLMNVGLFFMLLSLYIYLRWVETNRDRYLVVAALFLALAGLTKYPFLVILAPMAALFPFERAKKIKRNYAPYVISLIILLSIPLWMHYSSSTVTSRYNADVSASISLIKPEVLLEPAFWKITESYLKDNFTMIGVAFSVLGFLFFLSSFNKRDIKQRFFWGYLVGFLVFVFIMSFKMQGHNYHYFPIAPFFIILMAYAFTRISDLAGNLKIEGKRIRHINTLVSVLLIMVLILPSQSAIARMFDTQFFGLDVAGDYIRTHKERGDIVIHSSHQAYGVLWAGDIFGTNGIPKDLDNFRFAEDEWNASWLFIYNWDFNILQDDRYKELWGYISSNYRLVQFGFIQRGDQPATPTYMLFRKGGSFDKNRMNEMLSDKQIRYKDYELTGGIVRFSYITLEE
ncbi:MAG: hypothetical protein B6U72_03060, partial [Candidatus Altiarchaeales archaeon ex4484_2]